MRSKRIASAPAAVAGCARLSSLARGTMRICEQSGVAAVTAHNAPQQKSIRAIVVPQRIVR